MKRSCKMEAATHQEQKKTKFHTLSETTSVKLQLIDSIQCSSSIQLISTLKIRFMNTVTAMRIILKETDPSFTHSHIPILEASRLSQYNADDQQIIAHNNMLIRQPCHHMLDDEECVLFLAPKNILGFWLVKDYTMVIIHLGNEITLLDLRTNLEISAQGLDRFNSYLNDLSSKEVDVYFDKISQQLVIATMEEEPPPSITSLQLHPPRIHCCFSLQILENECIPRPLSSEICQQIEYLGGQLPEHIYTELHYGQQPVLSRALIYFLSVDFPNTLCWEPKKSDDYTLSVHPHRIGTSHWCVESQKAFLKSGCSKGRLLLSRPEFSYYFGSSWYFYSARIDSECCDFEIACDYGSEDSLQDLTCLSEFLSEFRPYYFITLRDEYCEEWNTIRIDCELMVEELLQVSELKNQKRNPLAYSEQLRLCYETLLIFDSSTTLRLSKRTTSRKKPNTSDATTLTLDGCKIALLLKSTFGQRVKVNRSVYVLHELLVLYLVLIKSCTGNAILVA